MHGEADQREEKSTPLTSGGDGGHSGAAHIAVVFWRELLLVWRRFRVRLRRLPDVVRGGVITRAVGRTMANIARSRSAVATSENAVESDGLGSEMIERWRRRFAARRENREKRRTERELKLERLRQQAQNRKLQLELPLDDLPSEASKPDESGSKGTAQAGATTSADAVRAPVNEQYRAWLGTLAEYTLPTAELLQGPRPGDEGSVDPELIRRQRDIIQETLDSFGIDAEVGDAVSGPRVTLYQVYPARGVKVEMISQISRNLAMELAAVSLRILAPIPGRKFVGIEVPNPKPSTVRLRAAIEGPEWRESKGAIPLALGRSINGRDLMLDLARAPHVLVAGATGSGKSVCLNAMLLSLLFRFRPDELRLILIDPKVVEFNVYNALPHLAVPVITETKQVPVALQWVLREMQKRYRILARVGARHIAGFNARPPETEPVFMDDGEPVPPRLPFIVIIIDELADIMMTVGADVETALARIAQLSRAVGIHTIIATQRPSVNVITGVIKANYPTRVAFQVTSQVDSRTIIDGKGAESLLGSGDLLFKAPDALRTQRLQGVLVEDGETERVVQFVAARAAQNFDGAILTSTDNKAVDGVGEAGGMVSEEDERLVADALEVILTERRATTSYIQRRLRIGYNRAALVMEILERRGILGPQLGTAPREILADGVAAGVDDE